MISVHLNYLFVPELHKHMYIRALGYTYRYAYEHQGKLREYINALFILLSAG